MRVVHECGKEYYGVVGSSIDYKVDKGDDPEFAKYAVILSLPYNSLKLPVANVFKELYNHVVMLSENIQSQALSIRDARLV
jgi:hypothetical protein